MDWTFLAPFARSIGSVWLDAFLPPESVHRLHTVPASYVHDGSRRQTALRQWRDYWGHSLEGWRDASQRPGETGIITCFPQLALTTGVRKSLARRKIPVVAWNFNVGVLPTSALRRIAAFGLRSVDRVIVHSSAEKEAYSSWFRLPADRIRFVPLQAPYREITMEEERTNPFLLAMGSARRDYSLLFDVLAQTGIPSLVVASPHAVAHLKRPPNVTIRSGLSESDCLELLQRARVHVIPVDNQRTASGQVTLLNSMMLGRPTVVTRCVGTVDYAEDGEDVLFVPPNDRSAMLETIVRTWEDEGLRSRLGRQARHTATARFSDQAIAAILHEVLSEFLQ
jgi:glycosyltransferase involved in cell wall biosynthesis